MTHLQAQRTRVTGGAGDIESRAVAGRTTTGRGVVVCDNRSNSEALMIERITRRPSARSCTSPASAAIRENHPLAAVDPDGRTTLVFAAIGSHGRDPGA